MKPLELRMAHLEGTYEQVNERLASIESRFPAIDLRFSALDRKLDDLHRALDTKIDAKIDGLNAKIDHRFTWTVGIILGTWITTISALLFHH